MKSSTGKYFVGLDHIRALAAYLVFTWHFVHVQDGHLGSEPSVFPFSILTEGHTGVALFMTLSGYLFTKILDGKTINYPSFFWNRVLRLAPLLILVLLVYVGMAYFNGGDVIAYLKFISTGLIYPVLPNGAWSITVELHFYLLLPMLLFLSRKSDLLLIAVIICMIALRYYLYLDEGRIQKLSYATIVGRVDQFVFGILAYQYRRFFKGRHFVAALVLGLFAAFWWYVDSTGGFYRNYPTQSNHWVWIITGTAEGIAYASLIVWYDTSFKHPAGKISRFIARIGEYSYSIYLIHFFFVFKMAETIDQHIIDLSNIYLAVLVAPLAFLLMIPLCWFSYNYIELPFLRYRTRYIISDR